MKVTLFSVKEKKQIAEKILKLASKTVANKIFLQICCPDHKGVAYLDKLLWDCTVDTFLPHSIDDESILEPIVITTKKSLIKDKFTHVLWLHKAPPPVELVWTHLYDFDDVTTQESKKKSLEKYHYYKSLSCNISLV